MKYCTECGNDITRQADHDPSCYLSSTNHMPYCDRCGAVPTTTWSGINDQVLCAACAKPDRLLAAARELQPN